WRVGMVSKGSGRENHQKRGVGAPMFSTLVAAFSRARDQARSRVKKIVTGLGTNSRADFELRLRPVPALRRAAAAILAAVLLLNDPAYAHSWYPKNCCHGADCRPVPCDELVETRNGIMWRGAVLFNDAQVKPSPDQLCHVCAHETTRTS